MKKGDPIPRTGRPNRTNHYENQVGALLSAAGLKQFNMHCYIMQTEAGVALFNCPPMLEFS